ncbi:MAG: 1-(5-phosphoribosyl)-5-[(5-phosphoribosylamino)methylideneamino]imidazole-4-carboxamide isomerase [Pseudomonadota bacterium]
MIIYPAIDLKDGKCVRLYKGDMAQDTIYNPDPAAQAHEWASSGFSWLHVVDLDGAVSGAHGNHEAVKDIIKTVDVPVQLGGGIRSLEHIERWLAEGVSRVILGTVAVRDPELVKRACHLFPDQIVVGIDARHGRVAVEGWAEETDMSVVELAQKFEDEGVAAIIYTDINRDGTGEGVNIDATAELVGAVSIPVIASGGVGSLQDIERLKPLEAEGLNGVIIGKALYENEIEPLEALKLAA